MNLKDSLAILILFSIVSSCVCPIVNLRSPSVSSYWASETLKNTSVLVPTLTVIVSVVAAVIAVLIPATGSLARGYGWSLP